SSVNIPHGQRPARALRPKVNLHPGEIGIPADVDGAVEQSLHLAVVIGKENVIDGRADFAKIIAHPFPYRNDPLIVSDRADLNRFFHTGPQNKGIPKSVRPMNSCSTSVVGAMTAPARASRKWRSTPT